MRLYIYPHAIKKVFRLENMSNETEKKVKKLEHRDFLSEDLDLFEIVRSYILFNKAMAAAELADKSDNPETALMAQKTFETRMGCYNLVLANIGLPGRSFFRSIAENVEWNCAANKLSSEIRDELPNADLHKEVAEIRRELANNLEKLCEGLEKLDMINLEEVRNG